MKSLSADTLIRWLTKESMEMRGNLICNKG